MNLTQLANLGEFMGGIVAGKHNTASHSSAELSISLQRCRVHVSTGGGTSERSWGFGLEGVRRSAEGPGGSSLTTLPTSDDGKAPTHDVGEAMPVGKELGKFSGKFTSVRTASINGEERVIEGTYEATVSGQISGSYSGTMTFTGSNERGVLGDLGVGYLDSGSVLSAKGRGIYWAGDGGKWEIRLGFLLGDQPIVSEGQISLDSGVFSLSGSVSELT